MREGRREMDEKGEGGREEGREGKGERVGGKGEGRGWEGEEKNEMGGLIQIYKCFEGPILSVLQSDQQALQ